MPRTVAPRTSRTPRPSRGNGAKSQPRAPERASRAPAAPKLYATKNDLPEKARVEVIGLLNQRLAEAIDLQAQCNVKGPAFIALHKLFDDVNEDVEEYVDLIAERVVQLGGIAEGTVGAVEERSNLPDYPLALSNGGEHVAALSDALAAFGRTIRIGIEEMNELEDAGSADTLTEI